MTDLTHSQIDNLMLEVLGKTPSMYQLCSKSKFKGFARNVMAALDMQRVSLLVSQSRDHSAHATQDFQFNLRVMRKEKGITLDNMVENTGLSRTKISDIERGIIIPTLPDFDRMITAINPNRAKVALDLLTDFLCGRLMFRPSHFIALAGFLNLHSQRAISWALTVNEWRFCFGEKCTFDGARKAGGMTVDNLARCHRLTRAKVRMLRQLDGGDVTARDIINVSVATGFSPLSLLNYLLIAMPKHCINDNMPQAKEDLLGGKGLVLSQIEYDLIASFICELNLIPTWQQPLLKALLVSEISYKDDLEGGLLKYHPFPLSGKSLAYYQNHPIYAHYVAESFVPPEFEEVREYVPDKLATLNGRDAYEFLRNNMFGYNQLQTHMLKYSGNPMYNGGFKYLPQLSEVTA